MRPAAARRRTTVQRRAVAARSPHRFGPDARPKSEREADRRARSSRAAAPTVRRRGMPTKATAANRRFDDDEE